MQPDFIAGRCARAGELRFDAAHDRVGGLREAMGDQPARAFRNPKSHQQNPESDSRPDQKSKPPADCWVYHSGIEKYERTARAGCRSDPKAAVDQEVGPAAEPRRDKILDCRIDGGVFAADAGAGEKAEQTKARRVPRQAGGRGRDEVNGKRDREQLFSAQPVGEPTEEKCAKHGAKEVTTSGKADLRIAQAQGGAVFEFAGQRASERDFKTVKNPG